MYQIMFSSTALRSFNKLDNSQKLQVVKALDRRRHNPHISGARLRGGLAGNYKIKLQALGLRIVYSVDDSKLVILIRAIGKRENDEIYDAFDG
jgi:mRNA interferase RelE/StbE